MSRCFSAWEFLSTTAAGNTTKLKIRLSYIALAVGVLAAAQAHAQSSVTLYGVLDNGIGYVNNAGGHSSISAAQSSQSGNRFGLIGAENLGGGLKAIFRLENGFSGQAGTISQGGTLWGRYAYVGLSSSTYGTVTLGRQHDSVNNYVGKFAIAGQWAGNHGNNLADADDLHGTNRIDNSIRYETPEYRGLRADTLFSFGGKPGAFQQNRVWSVGAAYANGPVRFAAAYMDIRDPNFSFFGDNATSSTTGSNMKDRSISGYASAQSQEVLALGGQYKIGAATLNALYTRTSFSGMGAQPGIPNIWAKGSRAYFNDVQVSGMYYLTPVIRVEAAYDYLRGGGINESSYSTWTAGADYFFSKRTSVYISAEYQHAAGIDSTGKRAVAAIDTVTASSNQKQVIANIGIKHTF